LKNKALTISVLLIVFAAIVGKAQQFTEYEVKAAYVFNFTKFIKWPEKAFDNNTSPYVLGIYGEDPFGPIIKKVIANRKSHGRQWIVKYYNQPEQIKQCHILFITDIRPSELERVLKHVKKKPILTVGDNIENFCQRGGIINFTEKNAPKRFEINNATSNNAHLSISAKLLMLSKIISTDEIKF
jgi:hypothetical protein